MKNAKRGAQKAPTKKDGRRALAVGTGSRFFLKCAWESIWRPVTKEQYLAAEQAAGFRSKFGDDHPATASFHSGSVSGRTWDDGANDAHQPTRRTDAR